MNSFLFTSESVTEGHPDKICDQISDAILDACLATDPNSRVAVEAAIKDNHVFLIGELTTQAHLNLEEIVRRVIRDIGYTDDALGFAADTTQIHPYISQQSADIAQGVDQTDDLGAGDQGMMFGYADRQTPELMPLPISLAHQLTRRLAELRKTKQLPWLRPDGKAQVTVQYADNQPQTVTTIVVSTQHDETIEIQDVRSAIEHHAINHAIPASLRAPDLKLHINPTGRFVTGGPVGDAGVTGRKIIVDTYGGWARHGGGCFSGKDATKVDRSAAYAARQAAISVVRAGLAERCEVQLAYAIGVAEPVSIHVTTFGTGTEPDHIIAERLTTIDFRPAAIIKRLDLKKPLFQSTATYGHFGRPDLPWEQPLKLPLPAPAATDRTASAPA